MLAEGLFVGTYAMSEAVRALNSASTKFDADVWDIEMIDGGPNYRMSGTSANPHGDGSLIVTGQRQGGHADLYVQALDALWQLCDVQGRR